MAATFHLGDHLWQQLLAIGGLGEQYLGGLSVTMMVSS